jgi:hypothetical protein
MVGNQKAMTTPGCDPSEVCKTKASALSLLEQTAERDEKLLETMRVLSR